MSANYFTGNPTGGHNESRELIKNAKITGQKLSGSASSRPSIRD